MDITTTNTIITALSTLFVAAMALAGVIYSNSVKNRKIVEKIETHRRNTEAGVKALLHGVDAEVTITKAMKGLYEIGYTRVLRLFASNGGKLVRPGSPVYATGMDVKSTDFEAERDILSRYEKGVQVYGDYLEMLKELIDNLEKPNYKCHVEVPTDEEIKKKNIVLTQLQYYYKSEGVKEAWIIPLSLIAYLDEKTGEEKFKFFYISLAIHRGIKEIAGVPINIKEEEDLSLVDLDQGRTDIYLNTIKRIYKKYYHLPEIIKSLSNDKVT